MSLLNTLIPLLGRTSAACDENRSANPAPAVRPAYHVTETPEAWSVTVQLPGVAKDGLEITAEEGRVHVTGRRHWKQPEGWTALHRESHDAPFALVLTHASTVDAGKIAAELRDGVLRVSLAKPEAIQPRKIAVN